MGDVRETVYIVGYNLNPLECGLYTWRKSFDKQDVEDEIERLKKMSVEKRAKIFDCTEKQAQYMTIRMIAYVPANRCRKEDVEDAERKKDEDEKQD